MSTETRAMESRMGSRAIPIVHSFDGQVYRQRGEYDYEVKKGRTLRFLELQSNCRNCGATFECDATHEALRKGWLPGRCERCDFVYTAAGGWVPAYEAAAIKVLLEEFLA